MKRFLYNFLRMAPRFFLFFLFFLILFFETQGPRSLFAETVPPLGTQGPRSWKGNLEVSYIQTSGNTNNLNLSGAIKIERLFLRSLGTQGPRSKLPVPHSRVLMEYKILYGEQDDAVSDRSWLGQLKYDHNLSACARCSGNRSFLFGLGTVEQNKLKGIQSRFLFQAGMGYYFIMNERNTFKGELGGGYLKENRTLNNDKAFPSGRAFFEFIHAFTQKTGTSTQKTGTSHENTRFEQNAELITNLDQGKDYLIMAETALITNLVGNLALKASFEIAYDNLPPTGFKTTDRIYKTSILLIF